MSPAARDCQTEAADAAHRALVARADALRAIGRTSTEDDTLFRALVDSGATIGTYVLGDRAIDRVSRTIEGVRMHAERVRPATEHDRRRDRAPRAGVRL